MRTTLPVTRRPAGDTRYETRSPTSSNAIAPDAARLIFVRSLSNREDQLFELDHDAGSPMTCHLQSCLRSAIDGLVKYMLGRHLRALRVLGDCPINGVWGPAFHQ